jgi:Na+/melibiose symporter-like transporter
MQNSTSARPGVRQMVILALMAGGFGTVEQITNNLVPITVRHFTDSAMIISAILATNRLFGFVVQPYVCWKSDFVRTRWGRRRPFFLIGLPLTIIAMVCVGLLPLLVTGDARHSWGALALVVVVNVFMQAVVDVNWGALEPLYADTFRQEQLGRASSIRQIAGQLINLAMVSYVIGWADINEIYPYLFSAVCVAASFLLMVFAIREQPADAPPKPARYNPIAHLRLLRQSDNARLAFICASNLVLPATFFLFTSLYVTDTLGLSKTELGRAQILGPFLTIALAFPTGWLVDRHGPKWVMAAGFMLYAIAFAGLAFFTHDFWSLFSFMTVIGVAQVVALMPMTAMVFQYAGSSERGQLFGIIQFTRAFSAFVMTLVLGWAVQTAVSHDPTPIRDQDIKQTRTLITRLTGPNLAGAAEIAARLTPETRTLLQQHAVSGNEASPELRDALVADFNRLCAGPLLLDPASTAGLEVSQHSRDLLGRTGLNDEERFVLNRSLLHDIFADQLSAKVNYSMPYYFGIVLAILATVVALFTQRGRFARTIGESDAPAPATA